MIQIPFDNDITLKIEMSAGLGDLASTRPAHYFVFQHQNYIGYAAVESAYAVRAEKAPERCAQFHGPDLDIEYLAEVKVLETLKDAVAWLQNG